MIGRLSTLKRGFGGRQEEEELLLFGGGGGEQAQRSLSHLSHALGRHQNRVLGRKGGPRPGSFFFAAQRQAPPRAQHVSMYAHVPLWMCECDRGSGSVQMLSTDEHFW